MKAERTDTYAEFHESKGVFEIKFGSSSALTATPVIAPAYGITD
jgi:hypothetical protein